MSETVDRCLCSGMSFEEIQAEARRMNVKTVRALKKRLPMGAYCSACAPYLNEMLRTGRTRFELEEVSP